jgi:hypothetical protein
MPSPSEKSIHLRSLAVCLLITASKRPEFVLHADYGVAASDQ